MAPESVELFTRKEMEVRAAERLSGMISHLRFTNYKEAATHLRDTLIELSVEYEDLFHSKWNKESDRVFFMVGSSEKELFVIDTNDSFGNPFDTISVWIKGKEFLYRIVFDEENSSYNFSPTDDSTGKSFDGLVINDDLKLNLINAITKDFF